MVSRPATRHLAGSIDALRAFGVVPKVAIELRRAVESASEDLYETVVGEVPAFTASGNPDVLPELAAHLADHTMRIADLLAGQPSGDFAFVAQHARRRAEQKFPLDAVLSAYRCIHKNLAEWVRDASLQSADENAELRRVVAAVSDFMIEYTGAIGTYITSEYVEHTRALAEAEGDRRSALMNLLLHGYDESDRRTAELLRGAGYFEQRQSFCVVVARSVEPREMEHPARAQRMADAVADALHNLPIRVLVGIHDKLVTVILSGTRRLSGWTAPQSLLADRVYPHLRTVGPAALMGVSTDMPSTSHIPKALSEARLALDFASPGKRVMQYSHVPFRDMLVKLAAHEIRSALPGWTGDFAAADKKARGALSNTLRAYADADMNVLKTAEGLGLHPNTIYARMQKIADVTDLNPLNFHALNELLLAADCLTESH